MELPVIDLLIVRVRWVYLHRSSPSLPVSLSAVSPLPSLLTCTCHAARCFGMCYPDTAPRHPPAGCTPGLKDPLNESRRILNKYGRPAPAVVQKLLHNSRAAPRWAADARPARALARHPFAKLGEYISPL